MLGGRAGDLLGRRRVFVSGLLLFSAASFVGGFATSQGWLLAARAFQGAGGALIAPTALALVATNFAEGPARNRAMGVVAAMSGAGAAVGLVAGGLLTTYLSWRWVLFVNVPIGVLAAAAAPMVLAESPRRRGRFDLAGAITGTAGVALLVYGLSNASTDQNGASHWGDTKVLVSLAAAAALLVGFVIVERRSRYALMPLRIFDDRSRSGAYLIMLVIATAMFGIFFFLSLFVQSVLGYSPVKSGVAFLPLAAAVVFISGVVSQVIARTGARSLIVAGTAITSGGMYWFSRVDVHTTYLSGLLGPVLTTGAGLGLLFVPLSLVALSRVRDEDSGLASSLLNTGQQVGGAIGLAALGTVAWTTVANSTRHQVAQAASARAVRSGHALASLSAGGHPPPRPRGGNQPGPVDRIRHRPGRFVDCCCNHRGATPRPWRRRPGAPRPGAAPRRTRDGAGRIVNAPGPTSSLCQRLEGEASMKTITDDAEMPGALRAPEKARLHPGRLQGTSPDPSPQPLCADPRPRSRRVQRRRPGQPMWPAPTRRSGYPIFLHRP